MIIGSCLTKEYGMNSLKIRLSISLDSNSAPIQRRDGDKGSPCLTALVDLKNSYLPPLILTENHTFEMFLQNLSIHNSLKPNCITLARIIPFYTVISLCHA